MVKINNSEWFIKTVENTANTAIVAGRDVNEVIHDTIEVIYGRKSLNELLPSGWIVVSHDCSDCAHELNPATCSPCFRCYNRFFDDLNEGPYTDNFKPKDAEQEPQEKDGEVMEKKSKPKYMTEEGYKEWREEMDALDRFEDFTEKEDKE